MLLPILLPAFLLLALLAYAKPHSAVILLSGLLPAYILRFDLGPLPTNFFEAAVALTALAILARPHTLLQWRAAWRRLPGTFVVMILLFIIAAAVSAFISPHLRTSLGILKSWIAAPLLFAWLAYSVSGVKRQALNSGIAKALIASGVVVASIGLFQIKSAHRVYGIYDVPNSLALFLVPLIILALGRKKLLSAVIMASALLATQSASGILAVLLTLVLGYAAKAWKTRSFYLGKFKLSAILLFSLFSFLLLLSAGRLAYLASPLTTGRPNSVSVRLQLWSVSWDLIKAHPVLGIGLGVFEPAYQQKLHQRFVEYEKQNKKQAPLNVQYKKRPLAEFVFRDPHNWILSFWLNVGLLGLVSFIALNAYLLTAGFRHIGPRALNAKYKKRRPSTELPAVTLALLALLIFGLADTIYWKNDLSALHWLLSVLIITQYTTAAKPGATNKPAAQTISG